MKVKGEASAISFSLVVWINTACVSVCICEMKKKKSPTLTLNTQTKTYRTFGIIVTIKVFE